MTELCPLMPRLKSGIWPVFCPKVDYFGQIFLNIDLKFILPCIYLNIDRETKLEVNRTQNYQLRLQKAT